MFNREGTAGLSPISAEEQTEVRRWIHFHLASPLPWQGEVKMCLISGSSLAGATKSPTQGLLGMKVEG